MTPSNSSSGETPKVLRLCLVPGSDDVEPVGGLLRRSFPTIWVTEHRPPDGARGGFADDVVTRHDAFIVAPRPLGPRHPLAVLRAADRQHLIAWPVIGTDGIPDGWVIEPGRGGFHDAREIRPRKPSRGIGRVMGVALPRGRSIVLPEASLATPVIHGAMSRIAARVGLGSWGTIGFRGTHSQHVEPAEALLELRAHSGRRLFVAPPGIAELIARGACQADAPCLQAPIIIARGKSFAQSLHDPDNGGVGIAATLAAAVAVVTFLGRRDSAAPLAAALAIAARTPSLRVRELGGEARDEALAAFLQDRLQLNPAPVPDNQVQLELL